MIFASGGFGANFAQNSLLATYCPDLLHIPTMNGAHCTGDTIKMSETIGEKKKKPSTSSGFRLIPQVW